MIHFIYKIPSDGGNRKALKILALVGVCFSTSGDYTFCHAKTYTTNY